MHLTQRCPAPPKRLFTTTTTSTTMATFPDDCLPPEGFFESRNALFKSINSYTEPRGYAFTTQRSIYETNGFLKVYYVCDRSRRLPSLDDLREGKRKTTTRMTNCPFLVLAKESSEGWTLKHRPEVRFAIYNHEPNVYPFAHPVYR